MKRIRKIIKLFPVLAIALIFTASVKNYIYFNHFGVNIFDFWKFDEIITSFLDEIVITVLLLFSGFLYGVTSKMFDSNKYESSDKKDSLQGSTTDEDNEKFVKEMKKLRMVLIIFSSIILLIVAITYFAKSISFYYANAIFSTIIFIFIIAYYFIQRSIQMKDTKLIYQTSPALIIYFLFVGAFFLAMSDINAVQYNGKHYGTTIEINDNEVISDSFQYYIGKTNDFIFVYDELKENCFVYQTKDIKKMILTNNKTADVQHIPRKGRYKNFNGFKEQIKKFIK